MMLKRKKNAKLLKNGNDEYFKNLFGWGQYIGYNLWAAESVWNEKVSSYLYSEVEHEEVSYNISTNLYLV